MACASKVKCVGVKVCEEESSEERVRRRCCRGAVGEGKRPWGCSSSEGTKLGG